LLTKPVVTKDRDRRSEESASTKHAHVVVPKKHNNQISSRTKGTNADENNDAYQNAPSKSRGGPLVLSPSVKSLRERDESREARKKTSQGEDDAYENEVKTITSKKDNKEHEQQKLLAKQQNLAKRINEAKRLAT
jgi:hypothetical protein